VLLHVDVVVVVVVVVVVTIKLLLIIYAISPMIYVSLEVG